MSTTNNVGYFVGYGKVRSHKNGITKILSLSRVKENHKVTFNSE